MMPSGTTACRRLQTAVRMRATVDNSTRKKSSLADCTARASSRCAQWSRHALCARGKGSCDAIVCTPRWCLRARVLIPRHLPFPSQSRELLSPEGLRGDGRRACEYRRLEVRLGAAAWSSIGGGSSVPSVDGAAFYSQGHTQVLAFVVGPRESKLHHQSLPDKAVVECEYATASFSFSERKQVSKTDRSVEGGTCDSTTLSAAGTAVRMRMADKSMLTLLVALLLAIGPSPPSSVVPLSSPSSSVRPSSPSSSHNSTLVRSSLFMYNSSRTMEVPLHAL